MLIVVSIAGVIGRGFSRDVAIPFVSEQVSGQSTPTNSMTVALKQLNGFRDLYWGESLEEIIKQRNVQFVLDHTMPSGLNVTYYDVALNEDESNEFCNIPFYPYLRTIFADKKLICIYVYFEDTENNFHQLRSELTKLWGKPQYKPADDSKNSKFQKDAEKSVGGPVTMGESLAWFGEKSIVGVSRMNANGTKCIVLAISSKKDAVKAFSE